MVFTLKHNSKLIISRNPIKNKSEIYCFLTEKNRLRTVNSVAFPVYSLI